MGNLCRVEVDVDALSDLKVPFLSICLSVYIEDRLSVFFVEHDNLHVLQKINYCMSFTFIFPFYFNLSLFSMFLSKYFALFFYLRPMRKEQIKFLSTSDNLHEETLIDD